MVFDQKKSILIITPFHKQARGNTITSERIYSGLKQRGWPVDLLSLESDNWQQILAIKLKQKSFSLVHGLNITYFTRVLTLFPNLTELPLLVTMTGTDINHDLKTDSYPGVARTLKMVRHIVIFNDCFHEVFQQCYPEALPKLITIPQGVALKPGVVRSRKELGLAEDDFVFLLPSGLRPVKNIGLALDAFKALVPYFHHMRLLILGAILDQQYGKFIIEQIKKLPWVVYPGEFPHSHMYSLLQLGDVVLNTSHNEGQPQAALEAMSLGKPCLLTPVPGNINIITHGREGYYVKNSADLAAAAHELMLNQQLREDMGANARRLVQEKFSLETELDAYEELYKKILAKKK